MPSRCKLSLFIHEKNHCPVVARLPDGVLISGSTIAHAATPDANRMTAIMSMISLLLDDDSNTPAGPTPTQLPSTGRARALRKILIAML